jgi:hypothetical protein
MLGIVRVSSRARTAIRLAVRAIFCFVFWA